MDSRPGLGLVILLFTLPMFGAQRYEGMSPREIKAELLHHRIAATSSTAKGVTVDCNKGDRIQDAIDKNPSPVVVEIHGLCTENVIIERKDVTLRGTDPLIDGIQNATVPATQNAMLELRYTYASHVENLSISGSSSVGVGAWFSNVTLSRCRLVNNAGTGLHVSEGAFVDATELTVSGNGGRGVNAQRGGLLQCNGCTFENNVQYAAAAANGGFLTLLNSTVTGRRGLISTGGGSYADIDCLSLTPTSYPCSMNVTGTAALSQDFADVGLYGVGDFTGAVQSNVNAMLTLHGARQLATGQPGQGPKTNNIDTFSMVFVETAYENDVPSQLLGAHLGSFARLLYPDNSTLAGAVVCSGAADAWFDPTIVKGPGAAVSGCDHGVLP